MTTIGRQSLSAILVSPDTITARNSLRMLGVPSSHLLVCPGPLERVGIATVVLRLRRHHMVNVRRAVRPRTAFQVVVVEGVVEQLRLVQPGRTSRRQPGSPPTVTSGEVILGGLADVAGTTVMHQVDPFQPVVASSEMPQE